MMFKVISKGFLLNKFSYLRNPWNMLDFIVVVFGCITEILQVYYFITVYIRSDALYEICIQAFEEAPKAGEPESKRSGNLDILRTFRVLRAVKTISILPGTRSTTHHTV